MATFQGGTPSATQTTRAKTGATRTRTTVTPSLSSQALIAANANRLGLRIVHTAVDPTQKVYFSRAATATSANFDTSITGSGEVELFDASWPDTGAWTVISDVASGTLQVIELTT